MDLRDLYQEIIVDHNKSPRNFRKIDHHTHMAQGFNPLCGDKLTLYIVLKGDVIEDIAFEGSGCAISVASASLLTERLIGQTVEEARKTFDELHVVFTSTDEPQDLDALGKLGALAGVRAYPSRIKCASLSWHALNNALTSGEITTSTE